MMMLYDDYHPLDITYDTFIVKDYLDSHFYCMLCYHLSISGRIPMNEAHSNELY
jgi:hypothetical protein